MTTQANHKNQDQNQDHKQNLPAQKSNHAGGKTKKIDVYSMITNNIIELLENMDKSKFQSPFASLAGSKPAINVETVNFYKGINFVVLGLSQHGRGYGSNVWGTYKQWKKAGATVRKGEKGTPVVKYKQVLKKDTDDEYYSMIRYFTVFNADQVDGYEAENVINSDNLGHVENIESIDKFVMNTGAVVRTQQKDSAFFAPTTDIINIPALNLFYDTTQPATANYYAVLCHELIHWTGSEKRLNRDSLKKYVEDKAEYAKEEICAEIGAAFLCTQFELKAHTMDNHIAYIDGYLRVLKNDKKAIFKISSEAQKAVDFLNQSQEA